MLEPTNHNRKHRISALCHRGPPPFEDEISEPIAPRLGVGNILAGTHNDRYRRLADPAGSVYG